MVAGEFFMTWKRKGSAADRTKYRAICIHNHSYKLLSVLLLKRLSQETEKFLPESQAGFRKGRGCRDNITVLRWLIDATLAAGQQLTISFIDFKAAFDTVSHKLLDKALAGAGASSCVFSHITVI